MKYLRTYKLFESVSPEEEEMMIMKYGQSAIDECNSLINDIKDILLELDDLGVMTVVGYTPMTYACRENTPKIMVDISTIHIPSLTTGKWVVNGNDITKDVNETIERLRYYVKSKGYPYGNADWESTSSNKRIYQMLIQK